MTYAEWADYVREGIAVLHDRLTGPRFTTTGEITEIRGRWRVGGIASIRIEEQIGGLYGPRVNVMQLSGCYGSNAWEASPTLQIDGLADWALLAELILSRGVCFAREEYGHEKAAAHLKQQGSEVPPQLEEA